MQGTIIITDLTQMPSPDGVCVVGIDGRNQCIRPVLSNGVLRRHLYVGKALVIRPRARIEFDFHQVPVEAPHIEDLGFDLNSTVYRGSCTDPEWEQVLRDSSFSTVDDIYDGLLQEHRWVEPGAKTRSMGTLPQADIIAVTLPEWSGRLRYRLSFGDSTGFRYDNIPVSDLAFREFSYSEVKQRNRSAASVSQGLTGLLKSADRLYLRLGLARPWLNPKTGKLGCWMQITGIYTFPDYLGGRSFADFWSLR